MAFGLLLDMFLKSATAGVKDGGYNMRGGRDENPR